MSNQFIESYCQLQGWSLKVDGIADSNLPSESYVLDGRSIRFGDLAGLRNGINAVKRGIDHSEEVSKPSFALRGVIEGFYGKPWSHQQRLKGLNFFAAHNMNLFILAPKDDPWQRFDWHTPFDEEFLGKTKELVERGNTALIDVAVCISPGLTVRYSSDADVEALMVRYRQLAGIGVRRFGLLLDDISWDLQFKEDKKVFKSIADAHGEFTNRVLEVIKKEFSGASLFTCPLQYHGRGHESYIKEFGNALNAEIQLMWTGRQICSEYLESVDARFFKNETSKDPFYWDNYPVNDVAMIHQLHVGPIEKRDKDLGKFSVGLVANPMEKFELSLISIATIGDYLWDSDNYLPDLSWNRSLEFLISDPIEREAWRNFLSNCFESCLAVNPAPDFGKLLGEVTLLWRTGSKDQAAKKLIEYSTMMSENLQRINSSSMKTWIIESDRWLNKYGTVSRVLEEIAEILTRTKTNSRGNLDGSDEDASKVREIRNSLGSDQTRIFGDGLDLTLGELATELSGAR